MPEYPYAVPPADFTNTAGFDKTKPTDNSLLVSQIMRTNFQGIDTLVQDLRHRSFSNNAVGKRTTISRTDIPAVRSQCWFTATNPAIAKLGVPIISQWITPNKVGNKVWVEASLFGDFEENIAFHVTRSNDASFSPDRTGVDLSYATNATYLSSLRSVHPRFMHSLWFEFPQEKAIASARLSAINGTDPQTIHITVEDNIDAIGTGYCYTVWAKATAGTSSRTTLGSPYIPNAQSFRLNASQPPSPDIPVEYGISTLSLTELWYINEA
jgi:hypothetical protein